jgi:hypothetical protein
LLSEIRVAGPRRALVRHVGFFGTSERQLGQFYF